MTDQQTDDEVQNLATPPQEEDELFDDIAEVIFQGVMLRVMNELPEDKQDMLSDLFDASNEDPENEEKRNAIYAFLSEHVPNFDELVQAELDAFKAEEEKAYKEIEQAEEAADSIEARAPSRE